MSPIPRVGGGRDSNTIREALESQAARLCAERVTTEEKKLLHASAQRLDELHKICAQSTPCIRSRVMQALGGGRCSGSKGRNYVPKRKDRKPKTNPKPKQSKPRSAVDYALALVRKRLAPLEEGAPHYQVRECTGVEIAAWFSHSRGSAAGIIVTIRLRELPRRSTAQN